MKVRTGVMWLRRSSRPRFLARSLLAASLRALARPDGCAESGNQQQRARVIHWVAGAVTGRHGAYVR